MNLPVELPVEHKVSAVQAEIQEGADLDGLVLVLSCRVSSSSPDTCHSLVHRNASEQCGDIVVAEFLSILHMRGLHKLAELGIVFHMPVTLFYQLPHIWYSILQI